MLHENRGSVFGQNFLFSTPYLKFNMSRAVVSYGQIFRSCRFFEIHHPVAVKFFYYCRKKLIQ